MLEEGAVMSGSPLVRLPIVNKAERRDWVSRDVCRWISRDLVPRSNPESDTSISFPRPRLRRPASRSDSETVGVFALAQEHTQTCLTASSENCWIGCDLAGKVGPYHAIGFSSGCIHCPMDGVTRDLFEAVGNCEA
jgi:hypothetical protein